MVSPQGLSDGKRARLAAELLVLGAFALAVFVASAARLQYGVDFSDEAYYASIPYRFVLGDVPYVSDLNVRQNAGLVTLPLVQLWVWATGGSDGLMLFLRYAYLIVRIALFVLAVRALWSRAPRALAFMASLLICAFILFTIPALGYNTLPGSAITASLLSLLVWAQESQTRYAVSTAAFGLLAAYVHPALTPLTLMILVAMVALSRTRENRARAVRVLLGAGVLLTTIAAIAALQLGRENLERLVNNAGWYTGPAPGGAHLTLMARQLGNAGASFGLAGLLWLALWQMRRLPRIAAFGLLGTYVGVSALTGHQAALVWLALGALPIAYQLWRYSRKADLLVVTTLSIATGITVAIFSTNGLFNAPTGNEVAALVFFVGSYQLMSLNAATATRWSARVATTLAAAAVIRFTIGQWSDVYRDDPISRLSARVPDGPYRGLRTTPAKRGYLERVQRALGAEAHGKTSLLVFNAFPAAHLMVPLRPALPITWIGSYKLEYFVMLREELARNVSRAPRPMLVLQVFRLPETESVSQLSDYSGDPLIRAVNAERPRLLSKSPEFALYEIP